MTRCQTHRSAERVFVTRRAPINLNLVAECEGCGTLFVVFVPAGTALTCEDGCGESKGTGCPECGVLVAFEAAEVDVVPVMMMRLTLDNTVELQ